MGGGGTGQAYSVGASQLDFTITVTVTTGTGDGQTSSQVLALGPTSPYVVTSGGLVSAKLLGDLVSYTSLPDFSSRYLMIPQLPGAS